MFFASSSPPFDIISPEQRRALLERDPSNAVRLELSAEPDPHAAAAATLDAWLADGTLERRLEPAVYYYSHARREAPDDPSVAGVLARVLLEPFGGGVRAHEHTMAGPKADRLGLLDATHTQLSPILAIYLDGSPRYRNLMSRGWTDEWRARDADGLLHPNANHTITFTVDGEGELAAVGNGDPVSTESYRGNRRSVHKGRCLAVLRSRGERGEIGNWPQILFRQFIFC